MKFFNLILMIALTTPVFANDIVDVKYPEFEKLEVTLNFPIEIETSTWDGEYTVEGYELCIKNQKVEPSTECKSGSYCTIAPRAPIASTVLEGVLYDRVVSASGRYGEFWGDIISEVTLEGKLKDDESVARWHSIECHKEVEAPWTFQEISDIFGPLAFISEILE